jgi:hypothetical protein
MVCAWEESSYMRGPLPPPASPHHDSRAAVWGNASSRDILFFFCQAWTETLCCSGHEYCCMFSSPSARSFPLPLQPVRLLLCAYKREVAPLQKHTQKRTATWFWSFALIKIFPSHLAVCTAIGTVGLWNPVSCDVLRENGDKVFGERFARLLVSSSSRTLTSSSPTRTSSRTSEASTTT